MEKGLSFLEFNYMIMQSYDFYYLHEHYGCNMQFGGDDQWSNMLFGTELIRKKTGKDAYAMTITLLMNSEGKKMGKTAKGAVWLDPAKTTPYEFYQYWRNIDDADVMKCIKMLTFLSRTRSAKSGSGTQAVSTKRKNFLRSNLQNSFTATRKRTNAAKLRSLFSAVAATTPICRLPCLPRKK